MRTIKSKIFWATFIFIWTIGISGLSAEDKPQGVSSEAGVQKAQPEADQKAAPAQAQPPEAQKTEENEESEDAVKMEPGNVTVNFKGADIKTVLAYISEVAGIDIVAAPDVKGVIDLRLNNKPWKVALDIIVRNYGFAYEREGDLIRVVTLDKLKQEEVITHAVKVNYGKAKDIAGSVEDIVGERGSVMYDERTNTVLVTDIPTNTYKISQIIERLDKETSQVLIEARVLETVLGDDERLGIDWNIKVTASGAKRPITAPFDYYNDDAPFLKNYYPLVQAGSDSTVTTTSGASGANTTPPYPTASAGSKGFPYVDFTQDIFSDTFKFGTLDFTQFSAMLEMIKSRSDTNIVSNPRITTLNNNPANIIVGQTINLPKYERNTTTGKMEIAGYEAKDLGIKLKVTPHINEKEEIVVDLAPEISDFVRYDTLDASSGIVAPVFSSRQANTKVMVNNGDTIFIGGMIKENIIDSKKKLPLIGDIAGDIPYLGLLFTKKVKVKQKVELIFFITVRLVRPGEELKGTPNPEKTYNPVYEQSVDKTKIFSKKRKIK
ncbi:MAG: secretin N-terminal domain-containing protein [Candidatus Omnitrophota bacterium]|jgi:type IV pilus assembly protein PilQ